MDPEPLEFLMGDRNGAHLLLVPTHPDRKPAGVDEPFDAEVWIIAGGFSGRFRGDFWISELTSFRDELAVLYKRLTGEAELDSAEGWVRAVIRGDGRGGMEARCEATDDPGIGNRLHFVLLLDQTYLPGMIADLDAILGRFAIAR